MFGCARRTIGNRLKNGLEMRGQLSDLHEALKGMRHTNIWEVNLKSEREPREVRPIEGLKDMRHIRFTPPGRSSVTGSSAGASEAAPKHTTNESATGGVVEAIVEMMRLTGTGTYTPAVFGEAELRSKFEEKQPAATTTATETVDPMDTETTHKTTSQNDESDDESEPKPSAPLPALPLAVGPVFGGELMAHTHTSSAGKPMDFERRSKSSARGQKRARRGDFKLTDYKG